MNKSFLNSELTENEKNINFAKFHIIPVPIEKNCFIWKRDSYGTSSNNRCK